ncbi:LysR family transcriptional regulator [Xanthomonas oryzae pv. oryzae]|nr:LysR family transcriptional regulator [Xanthomonas oryzae pv. oryzae]
MPRPRLPLNALRAFEAAARHQNLTRAADELCVSQAALSHQIKALEQQLGTSVFHRLPRGVALTDEGAALAPVLGEAFDRIAATLERFADGRYCEVLSVGVGTFATGWLLPRLAAFHAAHADIELRLSTHNNRVDLAGEGLDLAIRFGDGDWQGQVADAVMEAPVAPVCAPAMARVPLLRSYRLDEWPQWFRAANVTEVPARGTMFDSSLTLASAAAAGIGVALLPLPMFRQDLDAGRLVCPFPITIDAGRYWLTRLRSRPESDAGRRLRDWLLAEQQINS